MAVGTGVGTTRTRLGRGEYVAAGRPNPYAQVRYLWAVARCVPDALRELAELQPDDELELQAWAKRRGFTDRWALRNARAHAQFWRSHPETIGRWLNPVPELTWVPIFTWETDKETAEQFVQRVQQTPGLARTPVKADDRHFAWLARFQAGGASLAEIAENADGPDALSISTVSEAIRDTAQLVGLTLRRSRRGPRRKTSASIR